MNRFKITNRTLTKIWRGCILIALTVILAVPQPLLAQAATNPTPTPPAATAPKVDYTDNDINYYDPRGNNVCGAFIKTDGDVITKFLQALADQESGGNPKDAASGSTASGKYQYTDDTWKAVTDLYPPAKAYARSKDAPEEMQDAVAYIEYTGKFKKFNGDLFKLAVSHYYPAANDNPSLLDIVPFPGAGNVLTPRQYANAFIQRINSGAGKNIPIKAAQAPDFQTYLAKNGGGSGTGGTGSSSACAGGSGGVVAGDIVKTALGLAWPNSGHGKDKSDATPAYQTTMPKVNPAAGAASNDPWSDCGVFVSTVIRSSGADANYQSRGTASQISYIRSHPEKFDYYTSSDYTNSTAKLQPGDIMIRDGHTYIFTGPYKGSDGKLYNSAAGSWHDHVPQATNWYAGFNVARAKK